MSPDSYISVIHERFLVVAEEQDGIVGFGQLNPATRVIDAVYVLPRWQR